MNIAPERRTVATLYGFSAVLMWSTLALLTAASGIIPPFQLLFLCFTIAALAAFTLIKAQGGSLLALFRQPPAVWCLGVGGLWGYHALYFFALRHAPPASAGLIAYLWPLLIVLFSALLPGERLRWFHLAGAACGFAGAVLLFSDGVAAASSSRFAGYTAAALAALVWSGYSVLSRYYKKVPTASIGGFLAVAAILGGICHLLFEVTVIPDTAAKWAAVVLLGLFPVGGAFFVWDIGVKRGNIQLLGILSYLAPLFSTLLLVAFGFAALTPALGLACLLISGGALLAALCQ